MRQLDSLQSSQHFSHNVAVLLKKAPFVTGVDGTLDHTKMYFALGLVDEATKFGENGELIRLTNLPMLIPCL